MIVGDFSTTLSQIYRSSRQKINKETSELIDIKDQMDLTAIFSRFCLATAQCTFFSAVHGTLSKIDHILGPKASLNKYKKTEITPYIIFDHNGIKLELNKKRNYRKYSNT
jgi:hypothetical protein